MSTFKPTMTALSEHGDSDMNGQPTDKNLRKESFAMAGPRRESAINSRRESFGLPRKESLINSRRESYDRSARKRVSIVGGDIFSDVIKQNLIMLMKEAAIGDQDAFDTFAEDESGGIMCCIEDFERLAKKKLTKKVYLYYCGGADTESTLKRNCAGFYKFLIRPRYMRDVTERDLSVKLLKGEIELTSPICIAPTACHKMAHPEGELATARAADDIGTLMVVSSMSTSTIEEIAEDIPDGQRWFQMFIYKERAITEAVVKRAEQAGYLGLVVTIDMPVLGKRRNDCRNAFSLPTHLRMANFANNPDDSGFPLNCHSYIEPAISWEAISWLKSITRLPVILKGVLTAEDALAACQHGIEAFIVSNHGGRQLDSAPSTIEALTEIVEAVGDRCEVYLDGGIRTGNDVFKALALGAKAVFIGRPVLWGLAYDGTEGVKKVLDILNDELDTTMALTGC